MKHTPLPFFFPERCLFLSARCIMNPGGCTDSDSISRESHVSVKQSILQFLMYLWKATRALILSTLLSKDRTLASNILWSGGWCARLQSLTRRLLRLPLLGQPLGSVQMPWVIQTKDPLRESCIPGCSAGKLTSLWYPIVLPGSWAIMRETPHCPRNALDMMKTSADSPRVKSTFKKGT